MASPFKIQVAAQNTGLLKFEQSEPAAVKASELLQRDLETHHVFFRAGGFHNHIVHHILALFGTGAGEEWMVKGYNANAVYQNPAIESHKHVADELRDWDKAQQYLGKEKYYSDFLLFYQREIETMGWEDTLKEHLFKGDDRAEDLFQRMFAGFLHPIIQLMYGIEWQLPAIVAEAMANAAVHENRLKAFLVGAEKGSLDSTGKMPPIIELFEEARADLKLSAAAHFDDGNKVYDGILVRAPEEAIKLCSKVHVDAEKLEEKTAEMFHTALYVAAGAAIHPPKEPKFDFFLMHHVNSAPFFLSLNSLPWLATAHKVRILEWKIRMDIVEYAARACPLLLFDGVVSYTPNDSTMAASPADLLPRMHAVDDDGHALKLARSVLICREVSKKFEDASWIKIKGDDLWVRIMHLVVDSTEKGVKQWVRSAGFGESWKDMPDRK